jgi:methionyl-tRNA synthetase
MTATYEQGIVPKVELDEEFEQKVKANFEIAKEKTMERFNTFQFNQGLDEIFIFIRSINKYADERTPWKLAKSESIDDRKKLQTCLGVMVESLRLAIQMIAPVMPGVHQKVNELFGLPVCDNWEEALVWDFRLTGKTLGEKIILFPRDQIKK